MEKLLGLYTSKTILKVVGRRIIPPSYPPGSAPGHKLQKLSKKPGTYQSRGTINFVLFY